MHFTLNTEICNINAVLCKKIGVRKFGHRLSFVFNRYYRPISALTSAKHLIAKSRSSFE